MKATGAGKTRNKSSNAATKKLENLLKQRWPASEKEQKEILKKICQTRKASAKVSPSVIAEVMQVLGENDIPFVVAPFEADW